MYRVQIFLVTIFLLFTVSKAAFAQEKYVLKVVEIVKPYSAGADTIYHSSDYQLKWNDFVASDNQQLPFAAMTNSGFGYKWATSFEGNTTIITVTMVTYFIKSKSWVKAKAKGTYELSHEQLHFDITKAQSLRFKEELSSLNLNEHYAQAIHQLYLKYFRELKNLQNQYDQETDHGLLKEEQRKWAQKLQSSDK
ncbi:hypothetical protein C3K47_16270 [Solitalea longa]|uniref:DUF922 domain-containing protein n=1 Tax=Solitalea longa TaxID=2079460 RepID=A0A2S4ZYS0_9SPHI|nr:hypothetical protein [Solitalea longa]POY35137.1 hypothetical protein C3K47_16270 [Solitalea longa]